MIGGAGGDDFDFNKVAEIGRGATRDIIRDFVHLVDDIDLSTIDANGAAAGNAAFRFLALKGDQFNGVAGELRWFQSNAAGTANDKTIIEGDINGNRVADFQIQLTGLKTLTRGGFHSVTLFSFFQQPANATYNFSRGFRICSGGPNRGGYPRDGFLSLFHGPAYVGHQLFQIALGDFKLRRLFVHFHLPIGSPRGRGRPQYSEPK